jgi:hypothetical protein
MTRHRGAVSKGLVAVVVVVLVAGIAYWGYGQVRHAQAISALAQVKPQHDRELAQCKSNLQFLASAYSRFRAEHRGQDPSNFADLIPRYIPAEKMNLLICPTVQRRIQERRSVEIGNYKVNGTNYPVSYEFLVFANNFDPMRKKRGDQAPVIVCESHADEILRGAGCIQKEGSEGTVETVVVPPEGEQARIREAIGDPVELVVRRNGKLDEVNRFPLVDKGVYRASDF